MKSILKRIICFSVLGMLCSYDAKALSEDEMSRLKEAQCIGVMTAVTSTTEGGKAGMEFLKNKSTIWLNKYKDYTFEEVKPFIFSGIDLIKEICKNDSKSEECDNIIRGCTFTVRTM